jgi:DNA-binding transcriptional regulator YdaS (Cro superfamily)
MRLDEYLRDHGETQSDFAERLDPPVTQGLVSQWVLGTTRISLARALEIETLTNNEVTARDCAAMFVAKEAA